MKLIAKLRSRSGESYTELLCAVLITALATAVLSALISTSTKMIRSAVKADDELYLALSAAECGSNGTSPDPEDANPDTVTVSVGNTPLKFDVLFYGDKDAVLAYYSDEGGAG